MIVSRREQGVFPLPAFTPLGSAPIFLPNTREQSNIWMLVLLILLNVWSLPLQAQQKAPQPSPLSWSIACPVAPNAVPSSPVICAVFSPRSSPRLVLWSSKSLALTGEGVLEVKVDNVVLMRGGSQDRLFLTRGTLSLTSRGPVLLSAISGRCEGHHEPGVPSPCQLVVPPIGAMPEATEYTFIVTPGYLLTLYVLEGPVVVAWANRPLEGSERVNSGETLQLDLTDPAQRSVKHFSGAKAKDEYDSVRNTDWRSGPRGTDMAADEALDRFLKALESGTSQETVKAAESLVEKCEAYAPRALALSWYKATAMGDSQSAQLALHALEHYYPASAWNSVLTQSGASFKSPSVPPGPAPNGPPKPPTLEKPR